MELPEKRRVLDALLEHLTREAAQVAKVAEDIRKDATHEEARPENDKDTRALEQSYLARGQAMRAEQALEQREVLRFMALPALGSNDQIVSGALIVLADEDGKERALFLAPHGGGVELTVDGTAIQVVTPTSSLGAAILGRAEGDEAIVNVRGKRREHEIVKVR
jgi:transcription elongation GreA/GreB family factor